MAFGLITLIAIFLSMMAWIMSPFFLPQTSTEEAGIDHRPLLHMKQKLLEEFRDLEFDHQLNKMSSSDYQEQRRIVLEQLQAIYTKLDTLTISDERSA